MAGISLRCPSCQGEDVQEFDKRLGKQIYRCIKDSCPRAFRLEYAYEDIGSEDKEGSVQCPSCEGDEVRKFGKKQGKQIYSCNNKCCPRTTFRQEYAYKAWDSKVKNRIRDLAAEGNSARAISRILSISKDTASKNKKQEKS